ncbi:MAG: helix-turn-helix domain-containing protein [Nakamurella sp.]
MYDATDTTTGKNKFTLAQIAAEFGVTRPTIYRYLDQDNPPG